ncbi:MAG: DNA-processing protein DprA [Clostridia bacterium]
MDEKRYWFALGKLQATPSKKNELLDQYGTPAGIFSHGGFFFDDSGYEDSFLTIPDSFYPAALGAIFDPPPVLFYDGTPVFRRCVAVVGSRNPSGYGLRAAYDISKTLAESGYTVVSGLAKGIDARAHQGALAGHGFTIAVLGNGTDICYPRENADLMDVIRKKGCLLSEYPRGTRPARHHFPARNRIISGLCMCTVVIEAGEKSGSLITAEFAMEQGREVYALPHGIYGESRGTLKLLKDGCGLILSAQEFAEEMKGVENAGKTSYD